MKNNKLGRPATGRTTYNLVVAVTEEEKNKLEKSYNDFVKMTGIKPIKTQFFRKKFCEVLGQKNG